MPLWGKRAAFGVSVQSTAHFDSLLPVHCDLPLPSPFKGARALV
jgi:hypothetical protein